MLAATQLPADCKIQPATGKCLMSIDRNHWATTVSNSEGNRAARRLRTLEWLLALDVTDVARAMQRAADEIARELAADTVDLFIYETESDSLVAIGSNHAALDERQRTIGLNCLPLANGGRAALVFLSGESYLDVDVQRDPTGLSMIQQDPAIRSAMYVPLVSNNTRCGVLLAGSAQPNQFGRDDLAFLTAVAHWLGIIGECGMRTEARTRRPVETGYRSAPQQLMDVLTPRQREIAALLARGYSNTEIGRQLVLVPGTVANHVEQILTRLGFRNRTQVAAWAVELGLHRLYAAE